MSARSGRSAAKASLPPAALTRSRAKDAKKKGDLKLDHTAVASLNRLPNELLVRIASYLESSEALSFALLSKSFFDIAEPYIWQHLRLYFPITTDLVPEDHDEGVNQWRRVKEPEAKKGETLCRAALKRTIRDIILNGDARKMGLVRAVTLSPRPGVQTEMIMLLELVSPNLRELVIRGLLGYEYDQDDYWRGGNSSSFDLRLLEAKINFPILTRIRLVDYPLRFFETVALLCNCSPSLHTLVADLDHPQAQDWDDDLDFPRPTFARDTRIQVLRINLEADWSGDPGGYPADVLADIIHHCPQLVEAAFRYTASEKRFAGVMKRLGALRHLTDLAWIMTPLEFDGALNQAREDEALELFPLLRRLMIRQHRDDFLTSVPDLPHLETLIQYCLEYEQMTPAPDPQLSHQTASSFIPHLAARILGSPYLREVRNHSAWDTPYFPIKDDTVFGTFDGITGNADLVGEISTIQHAGEEVLIARFLEHRREMWDCSWDTYMPKPPYSIKTVRYTASDGTDRVKGFAWRDLDEGQAAWQWYTQYRGSVVPLDVISRMREVEGASEEDWRGRGIQVGDAAWKVLTDWRESL